MANPITYKHSIIVFNPGATFTDPEAVGYPWMASVTINFSKDAAEKKVFLPTSRTFFTALRESIWSTVTIDAEFAQSTDHDALIDAVVEGTSGSLWVYPNPATSGLSTYWYAEDANVDSMTDGLTPGEYGALRATFSVNGEGVFGYFHS